MTAAAEIIAKLKLEPHPEGGWFRQTYVDEVNGERAHSTAIYFLLAAGERSHWHRVDAAEVWHFYAGDPLLLEMAATDAGPVAAHRLGPNVLGDEQPQLVVPPGHWQAARSLSEWTLAGCTVAPGFEFAHFELAPAGWSPGA